MLFALLSVKGQENIGLHLSNYLPLSASQLNPALAADSKTHIDIHLVGGSFYGTNEHTFYASENPGIVGALFGRGTNPVEDPDTHPRSGYLDASIDGPGAFVVLGRSSVGLSTRFRGMFNGTEVPDELAQFIYHGFRHSPLYDSTLFVDGMKSSTLTWGELNFTFAHMLQVEDDHHLNVGVTLKRLFGQGHLGLEIDNMTYMFTSDDLYIDDFSGGYSLGTDNIGMGNGWSVDLGVMYRKTINGNSAYVPFSVDNRCARSEYRYEVGVSLLDFGSVRFKQNSAQVDLQNASAFWPDYIETEVNDIDELDALLESTFENDQNQTERTLGANVALPSALSVQFDYNFDKGLHLGAVLQHPMMRSREYSLRRARIFGIVPRYEKDRVEVALPISTYEYKRVQFGLAFRYLGFTLGSDDLGVIITDGDQYGADLYAGIRIPIIYRKDCRPSIPSKRTLIAPCWGQ